MSTLLDGWNAVVGWSQALFVAVAAWAAPAGPSAAVYTGYVETELTRLAAPSAGTVFALAIARGDHVQEGALIAQLDPTAELAAVAEARARLAQAQAQLADLTKGRRTPEIDALNAQRMQAEAQYLLSETEYRRQQQLVAEGIQPPRTLETARAAYDRDAARVRELDAQIAAAQLGGRDDQVRAAQANVNIARAAQDQAEWRLSQRTIVAPRDGDIVDTLYSLGEFVPQGGPVATLLPPGSVKVRFFLPETALAETHVGQTMRLACDGCPPGLTARVSYIAPQAEYTPPVLFSRDQRAKLVFLVEARADQPAVLRTGMPVDVSPEAAP